VVKRPLVSAVDAVALLNALYEMDPEAAYYLQAARVRCNAAVADHPELVVQARTVGAQETYCVGIIGFLNGLFGTKTGDPGAIFSVWEGETFKGFGINLKDEGWAMTEKEAKQLDLMASLGFDYRTDKDASGCWTARLAIAPCVIAPGATMEEANVRLVTLVPAWLRWAADQIEGTA